MKRVPELRRMDVPAGKWWPKMVLLIGKGLVGAVTAVLLVGGVRWLAGSSSEPWLVPSLGASALLLVCYPESPFSGYWPTVAGHLVSAVAGVWWAQQVPDPALAAGGALGTAILAMHLFKCVHPPGGATALGAVVGGGAIRAMGYGYVWKPVFCAVSVLVFVVFCLRRMPFMGLKKTGLEAR